MPYTYEKLIYPKPPEWMIQEIYNQFNEKFSDLRPIDPKNRYSYTPEFNKLLEGLRNLSKENNLGVENEGDDPSEVNFRVITLSDDIKTWVEDNLGLAGLGVSVGAMQLSAGSRLGPHVDTFRDIAYNYVIETGGDAVSTCFYEPKEEYKDRNITPLIRIPYDRLNLIDSGIFEQGNWYKLSTQTIHSVENLDPNKKRFNLTVSVISADPRKKKTDGIV